MWWALGLFAAGATYGPFYPSIKENAETLTMYMESMPEFLKEAFLGATGDFVSPAGYLTPYSEEVVWEPRQHTDPNYHYREIMAALKAALPGCHESMPSAEVRRASM